MMSASHKILWSLGAVLLAAAIGGCPDDGEPDGDDDDSGEDRAGADAGDTDTGDKDTGEPDTGPPACPDIEFSPADYYLTNGGTVSHWEQEAYVDANGNGAIDTDEEVDAEIDFVELCESDKRSVVLLMGTDN